MDGAAERKAPRQAAQGGEGALELHAYYLRIACVLLKNCMRITGMAQGGEGALEFTTNQPLIDD